MSTSAIIPSSSPNTNTNLNSRHAINGPAMLYRAEIPLQDRLMTIAATEAGLCFVSLTAESGQELLAWAEKKLPNATIVCDENRMSEYVRQIEAYFAGTLSIFTLPLDMAGTPFQQAIWRAVAAIPYGEIRTYAAIAAAAGSPKAVRAVGAANGANPIPIIVPCHRVIGSSGTLTGYRGGMELKKQLLHHEGFRDFTDSGHARFRF